MTLSSSPSLDRRTVLAAIAGALLGPAALAQSDWRPPGTLRIVVPFPPGGSTDAAGRLLAEGLAPDLRQSVIVENRPGAGTTIAAASVAAAPPDGTALLLTGPISHIASGQLFPRLRYDAVRGFAPVGQLATAPFIVAVKADAPWKSLDELLKVARSSAGKVSFGSSGTGASPHLVGELLGSEAGARFLHVPYKGAGPAAIALMGGEIDFIVADASAVPHVNAGRLRALAVTTARRSALLPDVPTIQEASGLRLDESSGIALLAPAGTPAAIVEALHAAITRVASQEAFVRRLQAQGMEVALSQPVQLGAMLDGMQRRYGQLIQRLGVKLD